MADLIFIIHFAFIIFVIFGGILVYIKPRIAWLHAPMVIWGGLVNIMGWVCPLTPLENFFRHKAGDAAYEGGYIEHYLSPIIYPEFLTTQVGIILGLSLLLWNLLLYTLTYKKHRKIKVNSVNH